MSDADLIDELHCGTKREQDAADAIERLTRERDELQGKFDRTLRCLDHLDEIDKLTRKRDQARAEVERLRAALNRAEKTMSSVTVFVTSRQRINKSAGEPWWREELQAIRAALAEGDDRE